MGWDRASRIFPATVGAKALERGTDPPHAALCCEMPFAAWGICDVISLETA